MSADQRSDLNGNNREATSTASPRDSQVAVDALAQQLEEGVRVRDLWKLVRCFKISTLFTIGGTFVFVFGLGLKCYPWWFSDSDAKIDRVMPQYVNVARILLPSPAQDLFPFLVPTIAFLEDEAESEMSVGKWRDSLPIVVSTEPFSTATNAFRLKVQPNEEQSLAGYAYRVYSLRGARHYEPLHITRTNKVDDSSSVVFVPECDAGDTLLLVFKISSQGPISTADSDLRNAINLYVVGS